MYGASRYGLGVKNGTVAAILQSVDDWKVNGTSENICEAPYHGILSFYSICSFNVFTVCFTFYPLVCFISFFLIFFFLIYFIYIAVQSTHVYHSRPVKGDIFSLHHSSHLSTTFKPWG